MSDLVMVKESECFFFGDVVDVQFCVLFMLVCVVGGEVWDRGELLYV